MTSSSVVKEVVDSPAMRVLSRVGLAAYGLVHLLVAWLAVNVALGEGGRADKTGALKAIAGTDMGTMLLWTIAAGLGALALWQLAELFLGNRHLRGGRLLRRRVGNALEALIFGYLGYAAWRLVTSGSAPGDDDQASFVARLLAQPYGKPLVAAAGAAVIVLAMFVGYRGLTKGFVEDLDLRAASPSTRRLAVRLGQIGYPALAVAYGVAGALVIVAALRSDPSQATGLDLALKTLAAQPHGVFLLLVVALGLAAFGVYALFDARYRRR
jgi:hypothetical protein